MGQAVLTAVSVLMGIAVVTNNAQFWMLLVASIAQGAMFGFIGPARVSFTVELVGRELLGNAISLSMLSMSSTRVFAPALAGMLAGVALFGIGGAYLVAGIFSVISFVLVFRLPASAPSSRLKRSPFADIADGVRYVVGHGPLRRLILSSTVVIMFGFNYVAFSPALVEGIYGLGDREVGFISTASSIGAVGVSAFVARRADSPSVARMIFVSGLVFGLGVIALGAAPTYWSALLVVVVIGGATTGYQALTSSVAMRTADSDQQGRVQSLMQLSFAAFGIAALPLGLLAEAIGLRQTFAVMGVVAASAVLFYALAERRAAQVGNR
jgi:MFS family permease